MSAEAPEKLAVDLFTGTPYEGSPEGWWTPYGGALDVKSGVIYLPGPYHPPSPFHADDCPNYVRPEALS